ncbi:MAG: hypothetical protein ACLFQV_00750 [Vulcanimicrobiota bacterium]
MDGVGGGMANQTAMAQMQNSDQNQAATVQTQMQADNQKQQMRQWQIMQDTQTKIFEIQQDVTVNKAKTGDKMFGKWDEYIRS